MTRRTRAAAEAVAPAAAIALFTAVTVIAVFQASLVLDGTRYFWLDDDQMISMRYGRNLAEGAGLVWNPGERVEGYTSLGWTLVMAVVHLLPLNDATFPLAMKLVAWVLGCWVVLLTDRALRLFVPQSGLVRAAVLITLALCFDFVFWSTNGFETTLLTALFVLGLVRVIEDSERGVPRRSTFLLIGALPLARSDAFHLSAALLVMSFALRGGGAEARTTVTEWMRRAALAALLPIAHFAFRLWYYGDWLPNTYYLKVSGYPGLFRSGIHYLKNFADTYIVVVVLVLAYAIWSRDRRGRWIVVAAAISVAHVLFVGSDNFPFYRYLAPWVPAFLVLSAAACVEFAATAPIARRVLLAIVTATTLVNAGIHGRASLDNLRLGNGIPETGLIAGVMIRQHARPQATVAVTAAGLVPYFSRLGGIDLLGKTDRYVAHLAPRTGGWVGHGKFDMDFSLSRAPDLIVAPWSVDFKVEEVDPEYVASLKEGDYRMALVRARRFIEEYRDTGLRIRYVFEDLNEEQQSAIYARRSTPEAATLAQWRVPVVTR